MSRPRHFGKSLTLSTLKAVFQNKKHLFKGLALENNPHDWKEHPVIHIDLGEAPATSAAELENAFAKLVENIAGEKYYQTIFFIVFRLIGLFIELELTTTKVSQKMPSIIHETGIFCSHFFTDPHLCIPD